MAKKIMWFSRHMPTESQMSELKRLFGGDVKVIIDTLPYINAESIVDRFNEYNADDLIVVAPLSVISSLTRCGIKPIWANMELVGEDEAEVTMSGRYWRFKGFKRVNRVYIDFEEV